MSVLFCTKNVFACDHVATARGEGTMSRIKGKGVLKEELKKCNLVRCMERIERIAEQQDSEAIQELCQLTQHDKKWSNCVDERWKKNLQKCHLLPKVKNCTTKEDKDKKCRRFFAGSAENPKLHQALLVDGKPPKCLKCSAFKLTKMPCKGICRVCRHLSLDPLKEDTLCPRWRICNHPLFLEAHKKLNLEPPEDFFTETDATSTDDDVSDNGNAICRAQAKLFSSIKHPSTPAIWFTKLNEQFKMVLSVTSKTKTAHIHLMAVLKQEETFLRNIATGDLKLNNSKSAKEKTTGVLPPAKK